MRVYKTENLTRQLKRPSGIALGFDVRAVGASYVCVEIKDPAVRYCDRMVMKGQLTDKDMKHKIERMKDTLFTTYQIKKNLGVHREQYEERGDYVTYNTALTVRGMNG